MDVNNVAFDEQATYIPPAPAVAAVQVPPQITVHAPERETQNTVGSLEHLEKAISQINRSISSFDRHMQISVHQKTNRYMVKVMDTQRNEIIREIPPEKALDAFAKALELAGILIDKRR
jgi:flagellar protein FlaG